MKPRILMLIELLACLGVLWAEAARAHGGFPETNSFTSRRGHPEEQWMGFTHGALVSRDSGQSWRWVCAEAMGYGSWIPESYVWLSNGDLLTATGSALIRSRDGGCTWTVSTAFPNLWVTGLVPHPTQEPLFYASTGRPSMTNALYRSEDGGETWTPTALQGEAVFSSVRVAPSDPKRLYVSGWKGYVLYLFRSADAGGTWEEAPLVLPPGLEEAYDLKLLAVSPAQAEVLWMRVSSLSSSGVIRSTVLRSDDAGRTLTPVLEQEDPLVNMDVSADGRTRWVATYNRLYRSRDAEAFSALPLPSGNACVTRMGDGLYACGSTWVHEWALARSTDEGTSWEPLFSLRHVQGVHQCPVGTPVRDRCTALWPSLAAQLGIETTPDGANGGTGGTPDPEPPAKGCAAAGGAATPVALLMWLWRWAGRRHADRRTR